MLTSKEKLNTFFVSCFYSILRAEERALERVCNGKLSLKEIHLIEAVYRTQTTKENNFSTIAKLLGVTLGTLTSSYSKLERKGYLTKQRDKDDKRIFYIIPTSMAEPINDEHTKFHQEMIDDVISSMPKEELSNLTSALQSLDSFFSRR